DTSGLQSTGAPNDSLGIPPTRPTPVGAPLGERPARKLPFTRKQLLIGGGGVLALIAVVVIIAAGGSKGSPSSKPKSGSDPSGELDEPKSDPVPQVIERATSLIASEDYDEAVSVLK